MTFCSRDVAGVVISTPGEAPGTLQKEWGDFLGLGRNGDRLAVTIKTSNFGDIS